MLPYTFHKHLLGTYCVSRWYWWSISEQNRLKQKWNIKMSALSVLSFYEDKRCAWIGRERRSLQKLFERAAYLIFQTSFEIANKISRFIALKFSILHRFATQIVIHLHSKDGSCCAFILRTLSSWNGKW